MTAHHPKTANHPEDVMTTQPTPTPTASTTAAAAARRPRRPRLPRPLPKTLKAAAVTAVLVGVGLAAVAVPVAASAATHPSSRAGADCAAAPSACGFPDATTTGVPAGQNAALKTVPGQVSSGPGWSFNPAGWVQVTGNNAVLSGLYIPYNVNVTGAAGVTIENDLITGSGQTSYGVTLRHTTNTTIANNTISGLNTSSGRLMVGVKDIYGDATGLQVLNNNIQDTGTGIQAEQGLLQGNYIHTMGYLPGDHINGITSNGGFTNTLTINHNTILVNHNQTDAIGLFEDFGTQQNRTITNNLLGGGSYAIYAGQNTGAAPTSNIVITGNHITTDLYPNGGVYGPITAYNPTATGDTFTSNTWDNTGQTIPNP
jgi:hypothetical protein